MPKKYVLTKPSFDETELTMLRDCLASGWVTQGPMVDKFEGLFAQRHNVPFALSTTSCTAALHLAMMALGIKPGDEVIVPSFTWITTAYAPEYVGARTVFAEISLDTFNISPKAFEAAITKKTKAVIVVHLFGHAAPMDEINRIAAKYNIKIIEDAACAVGTDYNGHPVGGIGDLGCFSLHPRKVITTGEGGFITFKDEKFAAKIMSLRNHGGSYTLKTAEMGKPYYMAAFDTLGYNLRMSDIQAAVGIAQMSKLNSLLKERKSLALRYLDLLSGIPDLALPHAAPHCGHTYQSFVIRIISGGRTRRNAIMDELASKGIQTRPGTYAVHRIVYFTNKYGNTPEMFPNACAGEDLTITLPIYPGMLEEDQDFIVKTLKSAL